MRRRELASKVQRMWELGEKESCDETNILIAELLDQLERGMIRAAQPAQDGTWNVNTWVKQGILIAFKFARTVPMGRVGFAAFYDKEVLSPREFTEGDGVRLVPGGSAVRRGAYIAHGVTIMPPAYVNVGAYVDEDTMIDSHALVGSCAQIGKRVHLSAACQVGGVLEPVGARPVIIEDDVLIGGNCGVYEGVLIRRGAVLGAGITVTASTPVFDLVNERVLRQTGDAALEIPEGAVVVPGTRAIAKPFAESLGLGLACGVIVKYRDPSTDSRTSLESLLRTRKPT